MFWTAWTEGTIKKARTNMIDSFKYLAEYISLMKVKNKDDKFWAKLKELQKNPEFRKGVKEFIRKSTS